MIEVSKGVPMASGPRGIDRSRGTGPAAPSRPADGTDRRLSPAPPDSGKDAVVRISPLAVDLSRATPPAGGVNRDAQVERIAAQIAANAYEIDPAKVAESIMKNAAPELFEALIAAGEAEE